MGWLWILKTAVVSLCRTNPLHVSSTFIKLHSGLPLCLLPARPSCPSRRKTQHSFLVSLAHTSTFVGAHLPAPYSQYRSHLSVPCKRGRAHSPDMISPPPWTCLTWPQVPCYPHALPLDLQLFLTFFVFFHQHCQTSRLLCCSAARWLFLDSKTCPCMFLVWLISFIHPKPFISCVCLDWSGL